MSSIFLSSSSVPDPLLQISQHPTEHVVILQLLAKEEPLDGVVVVGQQRDQILQQETLAKVEQIQSLVHL